MTPEQHAKLQELIDEAETKYLEFCSPDTPLYQTSHFKSVEAKILAYVHDLLAAKDKRIEELEAALMPDSNASITTLEGQRDYYRDLMTFERDENIRLARDLAEYEAYDELPSLFQQVMTISPRYVERFNGTPSQEGVFLAFNREHKEFLEACDELLLDRAQVKILTIDDIKNSTYTKSENYYQGNVVHEAADVLVTIGGILAYLGIEWDTFEQACRQTIDKLEKRTDESYAWDGKTVQHKSKIEGAS